MTAAAAMSRERERALLETIGAGGASSREAANELMVGLEPALHAL